eukprot:TRINITY_DN30987_c0_g1_i2.p1 TRINITY_DN30987_c0_g1~~TRINITY_DN30987_c0_g1_i2.p1  ORF type:complete len:603 (+),score=147.88 TRINITY_DN30987_c0_g1_i2:472-2280(+)
MSRVNLAVPIARDKTPAPKVKGSGTKKTGTKKTKDKAGPRAKSRSPNPSFCSVLSRVKDWEVGAFTPKTALADNVDILNPSLLPYSEPDQDCSPNNDTDWDWNDGKGGGKGSPGGSPAPANTTENVGLTDKVLSDATTVISDMDIRIAGRYRLGRKIGGGSFGDIYLATDVTTNEEVAVKLEHSKTKHPQLHVECKFYKVMQGGVGIPLVKYYGTEGEYNVMVMELLGPSLEDLFNFCNRKLSLKTVLLLADQLISRIEFIHGKNFIHRDMKPDNFLMGLGKKGNLVYVIDFGLAKKFRDQRTHQHIPYREHKNLTGTARYTSINTHLGIEQSRRDDMEALGYILMYFLNGTLPWQGLRAKTKAQKYEKISEKKLSTPVEELCKGAPAEFATYQNYVRSLRFEEKPDYAYLRQLIRNLFHRQGFSYDYVFDWNTLKNDPTAQADQTCVGADENPPEQKEKEKKKKAVTGSNQPLDIPTTVTTGATSAAAVTIKATAETQNIMPGVSDSTPQTATTVKLQDNLIPQKQIIPPQIINSPPAFHLDHNTNYGCSPLPSQCQPDFPNLPASQLLSPLAAPVPTATTSTSQTSPASQQLPVMSSGLT